MGKQGPTWEELGEEGEYDEDTLSKSLKEGK